MISYGMLKRSKAMHRTEELERSVKAMLRTAESVRFWADLRELGIRTLVAMLAIALWETASAYAARHEHGHETTNSSMVYVPGVPNQAIKAPVKLNALCRGEIEPLPR